MAADDRTLSAPVGVAQPHDQADVRQVQHLLNRHLADPHDDRHRAEDGAFGPLTLTRARLTEYQRDAVGPQHPNGIVAPGARTIRPSGHAASAEGDTAIDRLVASQPIRREPAHVQEWIDKALPAAQAVHAKWGIPVSVTIAQGAVESTWGETHPGNEYFGVKGRAPDGASSRLNTHEAVGDHRHLERDSFRSYASLQDAADDYGRFLNTQPRFKTALEHRNDPHRFVREVAKAHYATDPDYAAKVLGVMDQHGLTKYDDTPQRVAGPSPQLKSAAPFDARAHWSELAKKGHEIAAASLTNAPTQQSPTISAPVASSRLKQ